jgi:hypothetical protein
MPWPAEKYGRHDDVSVPGRPEKGMFRLETELAIVSQHFNPLVKPGRIT